MKPPVAGLLKAVVLARLDRLHDLPGRLDVDHGELKGQSGRFQAVANFVGDFMAAAHGQVAVHFHVEFDKQPQAAFTSAAFLDPHDAWHRGRNNPDFLLHWVGRGGVHDLV